MTQTIILIIAFAVLLLLLWQLWRDNRADKNIVILQQLEEKHRAMLLDFNDGLNKLGDRLSASSGEMSERLRVSVATSRSWPLVKTTEGRTTSWTSGAAKASKPNLLLILADDLGTPPVAAYGNGYYQTPNLDRLAREGLGFTDAYAACSVCSPTRASILTGQWPQRTGITDYIGAPAKPEQWKRNTPSLPAPMVQRITGRLPAWNSVIQRCRSSGLIPP